MAVKVCLDAGHYGKYNRSPAVSSYYESDMTWKLHNYLKKELEAFGIGVVTTRTNQNTDRALYERGAASKGCNLFISVHSNAVGNGVNENVDYPVAYVLLNGSSTDIGLKLAKVVEAVMGTAQSGRTATRQGANGEYYGVLRGANAVGTPGIILEHSFHTNTRATKWLSSDSNLQKLAKAEAECIASYYGVTKKKETTLTKIMGNTVATVEQMTAYIKAKKENINTLDAKGEVLLTILSSLAQDESRSISENCTWGIRRRFETGKHKMSTKRFLGYDTDENGKLVINRMQEPIVVRLYQEFLDGKTTDYIKRIFEKEGVRNWDGDTKWQATTLMSMLENEKYKGDALLQKSYTVDFLTKKRTQNKGEIQMFYVEDDHDAIISKRIWECVQLEIKRRKKYLEEHGTNSYSHRPESNPFASKIICGDCNKVFARKGWRSSTGVDRKVWQCSERYKVKGVMGCANRHVEEETLIKAYRMAWNALVENREDFMEQWTEQLQSDNLLEGYRAEKFIEYTDGAEPLKEMDTDFMLKTLNHIKVFEDGTLLVVFLDGTEIECKNEEE